MKSKEKPIIRDNSFWFERVLKRQRQAEVANPYDDASEKRQQALDYIDRRKLSVKPVRRNGVSDEQD